MASVGEVMDTVTEQMEDYEWSYAILFEEVLRLKKIPSRISHNRHKYRMEPPLEQLLHKGDPMDSVLFLLGEKFVQLEDELKRVNKEYCQALLANAEEETSHRLQMENVEEKIEILSNKLDKLDLSQINNNISSIKENSSEFEEPFIKHHEFEFHKKSPKKTDHGSLLVKGEATKGKKVTNSSHVPGGDERDEQIFNIETCGPDGVLESLNPIQRMYIEGQIVFLNCRIEQHAAVIRSKDQDIRELEERLKNQKSEG